MVCPKYDRALASKFFPADACNFIRVPFPANPSGYKPYGNHQALRESTTASEAPFFGLIEQAEVLFNDRVAWKVNHCPCIVQATDRVR